MQETGHMQEHGRQCAMQNGMHAAQVKTARAESIRRAGMGELSLEEVAALLTEGVELPRPSVDERKGLTPEEFLKHYLALETWLNRQAPPRILNWKLATKGGEPGNMYRFLKTLRQHWRYKTLPMMQLQWIEELPPCEVDGLRLEAWLKHRPAIEKTPWHQRKVKWTLADYQDVVEAFAWEGEVGSYREHEGIEIINRYQLNDMLRYAARIEAGNAGEAGYRIQLPLEGLSVLVFGWIERVETADLPPLPQAA